MQLRTIFKDPIDRPIEGVIKADDEVSLKTEVKEYVLTDEIERRFDDFLESYTDYQNANGVWISGWFGCGKSHMLKMISLLLPNRAIDGLNVHKVFRGKCKDAMLAGRIDKAVAIPSESILFNIDQKADVISKQDVDALLAVFAKVFDEHCGYYGKQGYIANFERQLDQDGLLSDFRDAFEKYAGMPWTTGRERVLRGGSSIDKAFEEVTGEKVEGVIGKYKDDYKLSIEDFAEQVKRYVDSKGKDFRLNFFVDEAGQYIADNTKLMTNLQTIAESLATKCRGRSWVIVTAQEDMANVIGEMTKEQSNDFSKIQARFKTRMKLTSTNVAEVIQLRLLAKTSEGEDTLRPIYEREVNNFRTLFEFSDGQKYRNFRDEEHFFNCYPFIPYQFELFQLAIRGLSTHNAFEGKHSSVGERSMLGVFQEVAVQIADENVGKLATFDLMYKGIASALKSHLLSVRAAEKHLDNPLAVQLLKALLLVKYVKEFKASIHNLTVLMIDRFDADLGQLQKDVEEALNLLENQIYIQRNGDYYEFLTDEEKDVEQEIKNTQIDSSEIADELNKILFEKVLKTRKLRYEANKRDFSFTRKLDDRIYGRDYELAVHFISPLDERCDNPDQIKMTYMGNDEVTVVLPSDARLYRDLTLMKQTAKYVGQNFSTTNKENIKRILSAKTATNQQREQQLTDHVKMLVGKARMFVAGSEIETTREDPGLRIHEGFETLVEHTYKNLPMLRGITFTESQIEECLNESSDGLFGNDAAMMSEPENEMLSVISRQTAKGIRPTVKMLVEDFETKPFGWPLPAIQCILAKLIARGKVEARGDSELLDGQSLLAALKNTQKHGNLVLEPQIEFPSSALRALKDFYEQFFDTPPRANEARALGAEAANAFETLGHELKTLIARKSEYPFLAALEHPADRMTKLAKKSYRHFLTEFGSESEELLDLKEDTLDPIRRFMSGSGATLYADARQFLDRNRTNFAYLEGDEADQLETALADGRCFAGNGMKRVKELTDSLRASLETLADGARNSAEQTIKSRVEKLKAIPGYETLSDEQRNEIDSVVDDAINQIRNQPIIAVVREAATRFETNGYTGILKKITSWTAPPPDSTSDQDGSGDESDPGWKPPVEFIGIGHLNVSFDKPWLQDEVDVNQYLELLRAAMISAVKEKKRIQI
ncbi:BREX system P-loop protein BrxC [uncultured Rubinisphaera sp.]|uniref:BREX system P-loop protein BrxC n=1 Tax=uncultured Rubinisphaera sp. TaxID=1678686 RepID=UPI0030DDAFBD